MTMHEAVQNVLNRPPKKYTKEEARAVLVHLGVLDEDGDVTEDFKDIFVRKHD